MVDASEQSVAAAEYSGLVRGPSAMFPRGGLWMFGVWYAGLYVCMVFVAGWPLWYDLVALGLYGASAAVVTVIFSRAKSRAFAADDSGIWLGASKKGVADRRLRVEWVHIRQLTISSYPAGSILQIVVSPEAVATSKHRQLASLTLMALPLGVRKTRPQLLTVLPDPPRYRVPLAEVTPEQLRTALSALAPASVAIVTTA